MSSADAAATLVAAARLNSWRDPGAYLLHKNPDG
jgi:hypothetical protein